MKSDKQSEEDSVRYIKKTQKRKQTLVDYKGGSCYDCSYTYPPYIYEFHHRDPRLKSFSIGTEMRNLNLKALIYEVDKCDLLCSNCHKERHYQAKKKEVRI